MSTDAWNSGVRRNAGIVGFRLPCAWSPGTGDSVFLLSTTGSRVSGVAALLFKFRRNFTYTLSIRHQNR